MISHIGGSLVTRLDAVTDTDAGLVEIPVELSWHPDDPLAVRARLTGRSIVTWEWARDLLAAGVLTPAGGGDVSIRPDGSGQEVAITLASPSGRLCLRIDVVALRQFLDATFVRLPCDREQDAIDHALESELARLLDQP